MSYNPNSGGGAAGTLSAGTTNATLGSVIFSNLNGISFGIDGNTLTASANSGGGLTNINYSAGTTSNNLSNIVWSNSNGISFGLNGSTVTATVATNYLTTARASTDAVGLNTAQTNVTWTVNSSGISFNAGAYLTTAALSNHSHGNPTLALTNLTGTTASASNGFTLSLSAAAAGAGSVNFSAGTTSNNLASITFSNSNGVSFGLNGSTITASVNAGGGGFDQRWEQIQAFRFSLSNLTNITAISNVPFFQPFKFYGNMTLSRVNWEMSRSTSGSNAFTVTAGIYSYSNGTALSLIASATGVFSNTATASVSGIRRFALGGFNVSTFTAGGYVLGMQFNAGANTVSMNYSIRGHSGAVQAGAIIQGSDSYNTATSYNIFPFFGRYSTTAPFLTSVADSAIRGQFSGASAPINAWIGFNND